MQHKLLYCTNSHHALLLGRSDLQLRDPACHIGQLHSQPGQRIRKSCSTRAVAQTCYIPAKELRVVLLLLTTPTPPLPHRFRTASALLPHRFHTASAPFPDTLKNNSGPGACFLGWSHLQRWQSHSLPLEFHIQPGCSGASEVDTLLFGRRP